MTDVALEWARRNVNSNPHISELIEIRKVESNESTVCVEGSRYGEFVHTGDKIDLSGNMDTDVAPVSLLSIDLHVQRNKNYQGPPVLLGVVKDDEKFDFCMCNPPFFENLDKAGLNPKTSCGGTLAEMVCPGGEKVFITRIIEESVAFKHSFRYYFLFMKISLSFPAIQCFPYFK